VVLYWTEQGLQPGKLEPQALFLFGQTFPRSCRSVLECIDRILHGRFFRIKDTRGCRSVGAEARGQTVAIPDEMVIVPRPPYPKSLWHHKTIFGKAGGCGQLIPDSVARLIVDAADNVDPFIRRRPVAVETDLPRYIPLV